MRGPVGRWALSRIAIVGLLLQEPIQSATRMRIGGGEFDQLGKASGAYEQVRVP
jgi:hypothetical protein